MRTVFALLLMAATSSAQAAKPIPADDLVRIREFYRLASQIQDQIWPGWSKTPAPLLLVTEQTEYLTHWPDPPEGFQKIENQFYARPRQFPTHFLATFPAFGPPAVIVVGEPASTLARTSTPWLITLMHEHFHQWQYGQPGYYKAVGALGLDKGDTSGMWMLNYPFPYDSPEVASAFGRLRDLLLSTLSETDGRKFAASSKQYIEQRKKFFSQFSQDDHKYLAFQLWQEGVARYTEIMAAEAAADYKPTPEYSALPDYTSFADNAATSRRKTLDELKKIDLAQSKREVVYSFGAAEAMLLDRINPGWKTSYFEHLLSTDALFDQ